MQLFTNLVYAYAKLQGLVNLAILLTLSQTQSQSVDGRGQLTADTAGQVRSEHQLIKNVTLLLKLL